MRKIFIIPLIVLSLVACKEVEDEEPEVFDSLALAEASQYVDNLIKSLRNGSLDALHCPDVQWIHIPALMEYGKSEEIIGDDPEVGYARALPSGPFSSEILFQVSEGMFALWMVEAARIHTLKPEAAGMAGWPSRNPFVVITNPNSGRMEKFINDPVVQKIIYDAYADWWKAAGGKKKRLQ